MKREIPAMSMAVNKLTHSLTDEVAEWLRRWTANPLGSPRVGSNPILVDNIFIFKTRTSFQTFIIYDIVRSLK